MSDGENKPCPFCGQEAVYTDQVTAQQFGRKNGCKYAIACRYCEVFARGADTLADALVNWNTRADTIDALTAENERLKAQRWQPIETAPKDGTGFQYFQKLPFGQHWIGSAIYHNGRFAHVQWAGEEEEWTTISPTHWMPLPAAPE